MAHKKQGGKTRIQTRSQPKYLGVKVSDGEAVNAGSVLIRQRGTKYGPGDKVRVGRDHTLYSMQKGIVRFSKKLAKTIVSIT